MSRNVIALCAGLVLVFALPASAADQTLNTGIKYYQSGNYEAARHCFKRALWNDPRNPVIMYWYANSLSRTSHRDGAIAEYQACLASNPGTLLTQYCRTALAAYGIGNLASTTGGTASYVRQLDIARNLDTLHTIAGDAARNAAALRDQGARQAADMASQYVELHDPDGDPVYVPAYSPEDIQSVRDEYEKRAEAVENTARSEELGVANNVRDLQNGQTP